MRVLISHEEANAKYPNALLVWRNLNRLWTSLVIEVDEGRAYGAIDSDRIARIQSEAFSWDDLGLDFLSDNYDQLQSDNEDVWIPALQELRAFIIDLFSKEEIDFQLQGERDDDF